MLTDGAFVSRFMQGMEVIIPPARSCADDLLHNPMVGHLRNRKIWHF